MLKMELSGSNNFKQLLQCLQCLLGSYLHLVLGLNRIMLAGHFCCVPLSNAAIASMAVAPIFHQAVPCHIMDMSALKIHVAEAHLTLCCCDKS